jgi:putative peptidoglycan lipid II flippase
MTFAVNLPAAAGLMAIGLPIVQLLFEHGRFQTTDSQQTAAAVFWYAVGLPGYSAVKVLVPVFYALGTTRIPVIASFFMVGLNAALNHLFLDVMHYPFWSLALATSVTATLNALVLGVILSRRLPQSADLGLVRSFFLHTIASMAIGGGAWGITVLVSGLGPALSGFWGGQIIFWGLQVGLAMLGAGGIWWMMGAVLKIEENQRMAAFILRKFGISK